MLQDLEDAKQVCCFCDRPIDIRFIMCKKCLKREYAAFDEENGYTDEDIDVLNVVFDSRQT